MSRNVMRITGRIMFMAGLLFASLLSPSVLYATPYASSLVVSNGVVSFYINESGGTVVVTYEDGSTNSTFTGFGSGSVNLPSGKYNFNLGAHSSYNIAVSKIGTGVAGKMPNVIQSTNTSVNATNFVLQGMGNGRGIAVNVNSQSPYFGRIYASRSGTAVNQRVIFDMNPDGSWSTAGSAGSDVGVTWVSDHAASPYRLSISQNDMIIISDESAANAGVWMADPNLTTNQLILGPAGAPASSYISYANNHGQIAGRAWLLGDLNSPSGATLVTVDGTYPYGGPYNCITVYSNITASAISSGGGWQNPPDVVGGPISVNVSAYLGSGIYLDPGLCVAANGLIYGSHYRSSVANESGIPGVSVYDSSYTNLLWGSRYNGGSSDYFFTASSGAIGTGAACLPDDVAVSPDCKYLATANNDGHITVCSLTNGIPDVSTIYTIEPDVFCNSSSGLGVSIAWDAGDNLYTLSYLYGYGIKAWTLGLSSQAITSGNINGNTAYNLGFLNTTVNVYATNNPVISQSNTHGNPTSGAFTLVRSGGNLSLPLTVNFTYGGTATNGTYTPGNRGSITFLAGQTVTNISIAAVSDGLPRPTTTLTLTVTPSASYVLGAGSATMRILNAATPYLMVKVNQGSMYNAFSNDYASVTITRWGDTNSTETVSSYALSGTAVSGVDYTAPSSVTFNPGDLTKVTYVYPLINGASPVHNPNLPFTGNKSIVLGIGSGSGYTVAPGNVTLTIVDSGHPPATVLFSDPLSDPNDAANWNVCAANANIVYPIDSSVAFGQDLTQTPYYPIPFPPNGSQYALRATVNKSYGSGPYGGPPVAINLYLTNQVFTGNYAVRFNMNLVVGGNLFENNNLDPLYNSEEGVLFGINHNGMETNLWLAGSDLTSGGGLQTGTGPWAADGIFYWVSGSGGNYLETWPNYQMFTGNGDPATNAGWARPFSAGLPSSSFAGIFKTNVFTTSASGFVPPYDTGWTEGGPGLPANGSGQYGLSVSSWSDVEIKQINGVVTMSIDKTPVFVYTNKTMFTGGCIMLGYEDPWDGGEDQDAAVYYSNLQVVRVGPPVMSKFALDNANGNVVMNLNITDDAGGLIVQSSANINGPYTTVASTLTSLGNGAFKVTVPQNGAKQFYRILQQ